MLQITIIIITMENKEKKIVFKNFNLENFKSLLEESITVSNEIVMEISTEFIRSASLSSTRSLTKFWYVPTKSLIGEVFENTNDLDNVRVVEQNLSFETFDLYFLSGQNFLNFLNVHNNTDNIDITFTVEENREKAENREVNYVAREIVVASTSEQNTTLKTTLVLSRTSAIDNIISSYQEIIDKCVIDNEKMITCPLTKSEIEKTHQLVKVLSKSDISISNKIFLNFSIDTDKGLLTISDSVFSNEFKIPSAICGNYSDVKKQFNILKSDFQIIGKHNHNFSVEIETEQNDEDIIILSTSYNNAIIFNLIYTVTENSDNENGYGDSSLDDASIESFLAD